MSRGHVKGSKKEQPGASDWYRAIEQETLRRLEAEEGVSQEAGQQDTPQTA